MLLLLLCIAFPATSQAALQVELIPTTLDPSGATWTNNAGGGPAGTFDRAVGDAALGIPNVGYKGNAVNALLVDDEVYRSTFDATAANVIGNAARTTEVWVLNPTVGDDEALVGWGRRGTDSHLHMLNYGTNGDFGALGLWGGADTPYTGGVPAANQWHHIAYVFDGVDNYKIYVDGVLNVNETVGALDTQAGVFNLFGQNQADGTTADPDVPGWVDAGQTVSTNFTGALNSVRIYDEARSESAIQTAFDAGPAAGSLTPDYTFTINRDTGSMTLTNLSGSPVQIVGYSIESAFGSLDPAAWDTVAGNTDASGDGSFDSDDDWTVLSASGSHTDFSEFEFSGGDGGTLADSESLVISSGGGWLQSLVEDIEIDFILDDGSHIDPVMLYVGNDFNSFERSDLNFDGEISALDWPVYLTGLGDTLTGLSLAEAYRAGDLDGDGDNDYDDLVIFRTDYDAANGVGAFQAMISGTAIPEPSTMLLILSASMLIARKRF